MNTREERLVAAAQATDSYDLLNHIAWTDIIKPKLDDQVQKWSAILVAEALGSPLPKGRTREQIAGMCYGIQYVTTLFEKILRDGKKAIEDLNSIGVNLQ